MLQDATLTMLSQPNPPNPHPPTPNSKWNKKNRNIEDGIVMNE